MNFIDITGATFARLRVASRAANIGREVAWRCICACGNEVVVRSRHLRSGHTRSCGCWHYDATSKAVVGYTGAHFRVKRKHGSPSGHRCVDCSGQAADWSYEGGDPNEQVSDRGLSYSLLPDYYVPRCRSCHRRHDWAARQEAS